MSTRSYIAIKRKNGEFDRVYCHSDGYLEYNGLVLDMYYKDIDKINNLIELGDLSLLGLRVNPDPSISHGFDFNERQEGVTVAYGRDRGELNTNKQTYKNEKKFLDSLQYTWCEYVYLYDEEKEKWLYSEIPYDDETNLNFKSLHETLKERNLIDEIEEKYDIMARKELDFIYDYDTYNFKDCYESYEDAYFSTILLLEEEQGITNFIKVNKEILNCLEDDLDNPEMKKLFDRGFAINEDLRQFRKELKNTFEKENNIEI